MEVPPQLPFDHPDFLASMDCEPYPGLHSVPGTVPPDFFINFPPHAPAVFSSHNGSLPIRRLPSAMPCPVVRTNFRHDVIVTAEKYATKFPQIVEKLEYLPMVWQDLYHFWDPMDLYVEDPGFLFHVLHLVIWNAITVRRRIYNRVKAWCHLNIHKLVDLTALTPVKEVLDPHDWHFLGLSMIPAHEITMTCVQLDLQRVEMREMIDQFAKRVLEPAPPQSAEQQLLTVLQQAPDLDDGTLSHVSQNGIELDPAVISNHHEHSLGGDASMPSQGSAYIAPKQITPPIGYFPSMVALGSQAMVSSQNHFYSSGAGVRKVRPSSQVHAMPAASSLPQADSKVAGTSKLGHGVLERPRQTAQRNSSGYSATKTIAELRDDTESPIPRVLLPGQNKPAHTSPEPVQDFDVGKMYNAEADWTSAAIEKRLIGIRIADAYDTATILKSDVIPKVLSACGGIESYRPQISDAKMTFVSATGAQAALKYNGKAMDSGPSLIVYLIPVWENSVTSSLCAGNSFANASGGENYHSPVVQELHPQIAGAIHGDSGAPWTASPFAPSASMPYMISPVIGDQPIPLARRPLPPVPCRVKSVTSPPVPLSNVNRARGQPNPVGHGLNRPRPRPYQQGYRQGLFSQYEPRHVQPQSSYQHPLANQTRFESDNHNGPDVRPPTGRNHHTERERQVTGPSQSGRIEVSKQENIKTSASSDALENIKESDNKDVVVRVTELETESKQSGVAKGNHPVSGITVLRAASPGGVIAAANSASDTFIVETVTVNFVAGNHESDVQSLEAKSGCKITIVPHADPLLQEVTVNSPDHSRPPVVNELRRLATEFQETRDAGDPEAGIHKLLETVTARPTNTTLLKGEHPRSRSSIRRLEDIEHVPVDSKATMQGSESFEDGIEVSAEDIRGSAAYVQKPRGGNRDPAELNGAGTGDWAVLKPNAQAAADALKGKRAPGNVTEGDSSLSGAFADKSAMSNSSKRRKSRCRNKHGKRAPKNDSIVSMASADASVGSDGKARRTVDEDEPSEVFYTPDEDSNLSSSSKSSVREPRRRSENGNRGSMAAAGMLKPDSNLYFTSTGDEPGSNAATDDRSGATQQFTPQTMNEGLTSMSMNSAGSITKRKKKKPRANRKKEPAEDNSNLSIATDGGEGNINMSLASAADVSAQGSSTSLIHSSDPAADINKAAAETTPRSESPLARGKRICREDRGSNGGHNAAERANVLGRPHQWPTPGMSLGNRPAAQSFGGHDSLPMMLNVRTASGRRDSMTATGWRPGSTHLIPGMTPYASVRLPPAQSQTQQQLGLAQFDRRDSMGMSMANAAWRASLPNSVPGLDPYPAVRLPQAGSQIPQATGPATNTDNRTRTTINVSVTSPSIVDTRKREPISKAWPAVKQWNGRTFQDQASPE